MKNKKIPLRICVGCNTEQPKQDLIRVIRTPEGQFLLDTNGKTNGRGAYLCKKNECLELALKRKGLERSFKMRIPDDIISNLKEEMTKIADK